MDKATAPVWFMSLPRLRREMELGGVGRIEPCCPSCVTLGKAGRFLSWPQAPHW